MAYIGKQPQIGNYIKLDAITTSATTTFNLTAGGVAVYPQTATNCIVSLNGIIQAPTDAYTISGSTIIFASALTTSDVIDFITVLGDVLNIGTPSDGTVSNAKLALTAGSASTPTISPATDTNTGMFFPAADTIAFAEGGTEAVRINSSGQVEFLDGTASLPSITNSGDTDTGIFFPSANILAVTTVGSERMRINNNGNVLVGTTSDSIYDQNTINGIGLFPGTSPAIQVATDPQGSTGNSCILLNMRNTPINGAKYIRFFYNGTSDIGNITLNGTTAVAYNTTSDYRLKENVNSILNAIERVKQLKPSTFNFKGEQNRIVDGFLAHEVSNIVPEAVTGEKDAVEIIGNITDNEGNILKENVTEPNELPKNQIWIQTGTKPIYQGIDQSKLVPLLTGALKEAIAKIEQLEARITTLENN